MATNSKEPVIYFHRDGKPGTRFSFSKEAKKQLTRQLRDENIRIFEERRKDDKEYLVENFKEAIKIDLTPAEIRKRLRGGKHGKKDNR